MRYLLLTIGTPASGKSTFIKQNNLEAYTIEPDDIRLKIQSPVYTLKDNEEKIVISQENDKRVWELVFEFLEERMKRGEFVVIDATHSRTKLINRYKDLVKKYRYRVVAVDFRDTPLDEILRRNKERIPEYKYVPEEAIKNIYERLVNLNIPGWIEVIKPHQWQDWLKEKSRIFDFNNYEELNIFGDIHGCFLELEKLYKNTVLKENHYNIWVGDYFDRAPTDNDLFKTFEFLESLDPEKNLFLTGNHEKWFIYWKDYCELQDKIKEKEKIKELEEKLENLKLELENKIKNNSNDYKIKRIEKKIIKLKKQIDKISEEVIQAKNKYDNKIRKIIPKNTRITFYKLYEKYGRKRVQAFVEKFGQIAYFKYNNKKYLVNHGGVTPLVYQHIQENKLPLIPLNTFMYGVGDYGDEEKIAKLWNEKVKDCVQIFGHRNIYEIKPDQGNCYLINGNAEFGGYLVSINITKDLCTTLKIKTEREVAEHNQFMISKRIESLLEKDKEYLNQYGILATAKKHKGVEVKLVDKDEKIYAINFKNKVFRSGEFDAMSIRARGLFVQEINEN